MANPGEHNQNESQFFITLDATPELTAKHTIFGRISGPTIYNVLSLAEVELSPTEPDRPLYPPKLHSIQILENPFDDIVPRITREEKLAQDANKRRARADAGKRREKVKKNTGLLSFGEAEETGDDDILKGPKSSHDLLVNDKRLRKEVLAPAASLSASGPATPVQNIENGPVDPVEQRSEEGLRNGKVGKSKQSTENQGQTDLLKLRTEYEQSIASNDAEAQIQELEASIRGLSKRQSDRQDGAESRKKINKGKLLLEEARLKYANSRTSSSKGKSKESETMKLLEKFQSDRRKTDKEKEQARSKQHKQESTFPKEVGKEDEYESGMREYGASDEEEDKDDHDWRNHRFDFGGRPIDAEKYSTDTYVTLDPRDTSSAAAAALGFGSGDTQKKAREEALRNVGRKGRDYVDERKWPQNEREGRQDPGRGGGKQRNGERERGEEPRPREIERW